MKAASATTEQTFEIKADDTWTRRASANILEYVCEGTELGLFMLSACVFGTLLEHPASTLHSTFESPLLRRVLMGIAMALTALGIVKSPLGQRSGAHFNPAVTLAFWKLGKIHTVDAVFYILFQFAGGVAGVFAAGLLIGPPLGQASVNYVATLPGAGGLAVAFAAECSISFVLMWTVLHMSNRRESSRYTAYIGALLIAFFITFEAPLSGMSMNPARSFGSAVFANACDVLWIYFTAPPLAMMLAALAYTQSSGRGRIFCAKLDHHNQHRCIFRCRFGELRDSQNRPGELE